MDYQSAERPWRWALALFLCQCLALGIRTGEIGSLFQLGLIVFGIVSLPGVSAAFLGARMRRRWA